VGEAFLDRPAADEHGLEQPVTGVEQHGHEPLLVKGRKLRGEQPVNGFGQIQVFLAALVERRQGMQASGRREPPGLESGRFRGVCRPRRIWTATIGPIR
jgi:hypothetical protein